MKNRIDERVYVVEAEGGSCSSTHITMVLRSCCDSGVETRAKRITGRVFSTLDGDTVSKNECSGGMVRVALAFVDKTNNVLWHTL